jgi:hypothetical protein
VLVVAIDGNASIGIKSSGDWGEATPCAGEHGLAHVNASGERMRSYLIMCEMIAVSTFYKKKPKRHATWWHPNPNFLEQTHGRKNRTFQLDHFFMHGEDRKRVRDCGKAAPRLASDHGAIKLLLKLKTKLTPRREPDQRAALTLLGRNPLRGKEINGTKVRVAG